MIKLISETYVDTFNRKVNEARKEGFERVGDLKVTAQHMGGQRHISGNIYYTVLMEKNHG